MDHFVAHKFIWMSLYLTNVWSDEEISLSSFKERDFLLTQLKSVTSLMKPSTQWEVQAHHELAIDLVGTLWVRC